MPVKSRFAKYQPCRGRKNTTAAARKEAGELNGETGSAYPDWAWELFALSEEAGVPLSEAFTRLWTLPYRTGVPCAVEAARALLTFRRLTSGAGAVRMLRGFYIEGDREGFELAAALWRRVLEDVE